MSSGVISLESELVIIVRAEICCGKEVVADQESLVIIKMLGNSFVLIYPVM
jgi:hypothetical protein